MPFYYEAACVCDMGRVRQNNEDNFFFNGQLMIKENTGLPGNLYFTFRQDSSVFAVFDGMGGHDDGQIASYLCASYFKEHGSFFEDVTDKEQKLADIIRQINLIVSNEAAKNKSNMGCTAAIVFFTQDSLSIANVGDSRIYRFRDEKMEQLSLDHLEELPAGVQTRKARLTQCIGIPEEEMAVVPYIKSFEIRLNDIYLLCSDGLTDMLTDPEIETLLSRNCSIKDRAEMLRKASLQRGGKDNLTAMLILIGQDKEKKEPESVE